jgi:hypothetical protein
MLDSFSLFPQLTQAANGECIKIGPELVFALRRVTQAAPGNMPSGG